MASKRRNRKSTESTGLRRVKVDYVAAFGQPPQRDEICYVSEGRTPNHGPSHMTGPGLRYPTR